MKNNIHEFSYINNLKNLRLSFFKTLRILTLNRETCLVFMLSKSLRRKIAKKFETGSEPKSLSIFFINNFFFSSQPMPQQFPPNSGAPSGFPPSSAAPSGSSTGGFPPTPTSPVQNLASRLGNYSLNQVKKNQNLF